MPVRRSVVIRSDDRFFAAPVAAKGPIARGLGVQGSVLDGLHGNSENNDAVEAVVRRKAAAPCARHPSDPG
jgi:hypothetical protein